MDLFEEIYKLTRQIPKGRVSTYGEIARALGDIMASRAVGFALNINPNPEKTPCYRVVYSDGSIGGFSRGMEEKIDRLKRDGIKIKYEKLVDFEKLLFNEFNTSFPLKKLREEQIKLQKKVKTYGDIENVKTVAGIDVGYSKRDKRLGCAAYVAIDYRSKHAIEKKTFCGRVNFPYIPTYLSYRENPLLLKLYTKIKEKPSLIMVDGNGILHPYKIGLASHFGVSIDIPTIGIAKSLLFEKIWKKTDDGFILDKNGNKIGFSLISSKNVKRPVYISPGHKISLDRAIEIVKNSCIYRIPEPIRQAHLLAKEIIRAKDQDLQISTP